MTDPLPAAEGERPQSAEVEMELLDLFEDLGGEFHLEQEPHAADPFRDIPFEYCSDSGSGLSVSGAGSGSDAESQRGGSPFDPFDPVAFFTDSFDLDQEQDQEPSSSSANPPLSATRGSTPEGSGEDLGVFITAEELVRQKRERSPTKREGPRALSVATSTSSRASTCSSGDSTSSASVVTKRAAAAAAGSHKRKAATVAVEPLPKRRTPQTTRAPAAVLQRKTQHALEAERAAAAAAAAEREANMSPLELKRLKREKKKARNRQLAAESRERRKIRTNALEEENKALKARVRHLENQVLLLQSAGRAGGSGSSASSVAGSVDTDDASLPGPDARTVAKSRGKAQRAKDATLVKGAAAMGLTMSMVLFTDTTGSASPASEGSFEMIGFWALGWGMLRDSGFLSVRALLPHVMALLFGVVMTLAFVSLFYFRTLHGKRCGGSASLAPLARQRRGSVSSRSYLPTSADAKCAAHALHVVQRVAPALGL